MLAANGRKDEARSEAAADRQLPLDGEIFLDHIAHFVPDLPPGSERVSSNDVTIDDRGLIYLLDRVRGLTIVERT